MMPFSVASSRLHWLSGLALVLGCILAALGKDQPATAFISAGVAWGTVTSKQEK
jgi:hypothetical protein